LFRFLLSWASPSGDAFLLKKPTGRFCAQKRRNSIIPHRRTFCQEKICTNFKPKKSQNLCNIPILQTPSPSAIIILVKGTENKKTSKKIKKNS